MSVQDVTAASDGAYMNDLVFKRNPLTLAVFLPQVSSVFFALRQILTLFFAETVSAFRNESCFYLRTFVVYSMFIFYPFLGHQLAVPIELRISFWDKTRF